MSDAVVHLVMKARDEATAQIRAVSGELGVLSKGVGKIAGAFGLGGLGVSAIVTAAAAVVGLATSYAKTVEEAAKAGSAMGLTREEFARTRKEAEQFTRQTLLMKQHWRAFTDELARNSLGTATGVIASINAIGKDLASGPKGWASLLQAAQGPVGWAAWVTRHAGDNSKEKIVPEPDEKQKARLTRIQDLIDTMRIARNLATVLVDELDHIEQARKSVSTLQTLFEGLGGEGKVTDTSAGDVKPRFGAGRFGTPPVDAPAAFDQAEQARVVSDMLKTASKLSGEMAFLRTQFNLVARAAETTSGAVLGAFQSWDFGSKGAADRIRDNFRNALKAIADDVFRLGLGSILGLAGTAIGGPIGGFIGRVGGDLIGGNAIAPAHGAGAAVQITNIYSTAFSTKDAFDQLQSSGELGQAQARQRILKRAGHN